MYKERKIDYVIEKSYADDGHDYRLIFRFYPRKSNCHSFGDEPPKSWRDVYKVYYSYAVIKQYKFDHNDEWQTHVIFDSGCDECSIISEIGERCLLLADGLESFKTEDGREINLLNQSVYPFGMGTEWMIQKRTGIDDVYYFFMLFDYFGKGCKFIVDAKDIKSFGEYLLGCCEYMLAHGDPI